MLTRFIIFIFFETLLILGKSVAAQDNELMFEHLNSENGLPYSTINDILQDKKGFIWFVTQNGLTRYDGYNFKTFKTDPKNAQSISDNWIYCLFEDSKGILYAGTWDQGLNIYNSQKEQFTRYNATPGDNNLGSDRIRSIKEDSKGIIWIGTADKGLFSFDKKTNKFTYFSLPLTCANNCMDMAIDKDNNIWLITSLLELIKFQPEIKEFSVINIFSAKQAAEIQPKLLLDKEENLWIGTNLDGLFFYDISNKTTKHWNQDLNNSRSLNSNNITDILQTIDGQIWLATDGGGIDVLDYETGEIYHNLSIQNNPGSLSTNAVYCLYSDNNNSIWAGTYLGGINIFKPEKKKFSCYRPNSNKTFEFASNSVLSFYEDKDNDLLIGTDGSGLYLYNCEKYGEKFIDFKVDGNGTKTSCPDFVKTIYQTSDRTLWLGTWNKGLVKLDKKNREFNYLGWNAKNPEKISGPAVWSITEADDHLLWIGVWPYGIDVYNWEKNKVVKHYNQTTGFIGKYVVQIFKDSKERIWIATYDAGISRYIAGSDRFVNYQHNSKVLNSLSSNIVSTIFEDSKGNIWFGTLGGGLNKYNENTDDFTFLNENNGLISNEIAGILEDIKGDLWISTYKGISKFSTADSTIRNYDTYDGLQGIIFNDGAALNALDGKFYFGGTKGFNSFYPEQIIDDIVQTPLYITSFTVFNELITVNSPDSILKKSILETKEITLPYNKSDFTFEFNAINFNRSKKNEYAYKLENFDDNWNFVGTKRYATYTNLDPGEYIFEVKSTNNDGIWNDVPTAIKITITPPFWERWWFRVFFILFVVGVIIYIYKLRTRQLLLQKKELTQKVKERTRELESANKDLEERHEEILQKSEELKATLSLLNTTQNRLIQSEKMASLGVLSAGVAHEINNPLNYIMGAHTALEDYFKDHGSADKSKTDIVQNSILVGIERISAILKGLNQFCRNNEQLDEECDIHLIIDNCLVMLQNKIKHKAEIKKDYFNDHILIRGNVGKLHQVFINVLANSLQAISDKGIIKIRTCVSEKNLVITIEDNGSGIEKKNLSNITDPFFTTKAPGEGTGLGLSITYSIIKDHNGNLEFQSEVDRGTIVIISLPVIPSEGHVFQ